MLKKTGSLKVNGRAPGDPSPAGQAGADLNRFRVDFDRDKFTRLLLDKGYEVTWSKAQFCPNRSGPSPRDHDINCTICDSSGFLYFDPIDTRMLMTSLAVNEQYYAFGRFDSGKHNVTALPEFKLSFWDKLEMTKSVGRFTQLLMRQPGTMQDVAKYEALELVNVTWVNESTEAVETALIGVEVTIVDGEIVWTDDTRRPNDRQLYSVAYTYRPQYIITDLPHHVRDTYVSVSDKDSHVEMPVSAIAELNFLIRDEGEDKVGEDNRHNPFGV
jgi:hypothetical protein